MEEKKPDTVKLLPAGEPEEVPNEVMEPAKESFLRRALNRTKEAFRNVDEAITGRETFKRIDERFQHQTELYETLVTRLEQSSEEMENLRARFDTEVKAIVDASAEQRVAFDRTMAEIITTAAELRTTAKSAEEAL